MHMDRINKLFEQDLKVINIGIESFFSSLVEQGVSAVNVTWKPPAGGNQKLLSILDKLNN